MLTDITPTFKIDEHLKDFILLLEQYGFKIYHQTKKVYNLENSIKNNSLKYITLMRNKEKFVFTIPTYHEQLIRKDTEFAQKDYFEYCGHSNQGLDYIVTEHEKNRVNNIRKSLGKHDIEGNKKANITHIGLDFTFKDVCELKNLLERIFYLLGEIDTIIAKTEDDTNPLMKTERNALIKARVNQNIFRKSIEDRWNQKCSVTECSQLDMLIASHIKPWSKSIETEKLSADNGLLLTPNLDKAFDLGYISFTDDGNIMLSSQVSKQIFQLLGIHDMMTLCSPLNNQQKEFMKYHREYIFNAKKRD